MSDVKERILDFLGKCEEMKKCKFIMATTKIKDLLKCIVNCPELYNLFEAVCSDFNYPFVKSKCLVTVNDGFSRSYVVLPQTVGQRLAFIFCLFVEFDKETINFNDFLQRYFLEDGSYYASYQAFCNLVIVGLQEAISQVFREELSAPSQTHVEEVAPANAEKAGLISAIDLAISAEKQNLADNGRISEEEKVNGGHILDELARAVHAQDMNLINALICGYNYFALYNNCTSEVLGELIGEIGYFGRLI